MAKMKRQMSIRSASGMEPGDYGYGLLGYAWMKEKRTLEFCDDWSMWIKHGFRKSGQII